MFIFLKFVLLDVYTYSTSLFYNQPDHTWLSELSQMLLNLEEDAYIDVHVFHNGSEVCLVGSLYLLIILHSTISWISIVGLFQMLLNLEDTYTCYFIIFTTTWMSHIHLIFLRCNGRAKWTPSSNYLKWLLVDVPIAINSYST